MSRQAERRTVYAAGLVQGVVLVTFPAASTIFTAAGSYGLSGTQYGAMFLPQACLAVAAALAEGGLARRFGAKRVYLAAAVAPGRAPAGFCQELTRARTAGERPRREVPERWLVRMRAPGESARGQVPGRRVLEPPGRGTGQRMALAGPRTGDVVSKHAGHLPGRAEVVSSGSDQTASGLRRTGSYRRRDDVCVATGAT